MKRQGRHPIEKKEILLSQSQIQIPLDPGILNDLRIGILSQDIAHRIIPRKVEQQKNQQGNT
jgi:hypothetical protein